MDKDASYDLEYAYSGISDCRSVIDWRPHACRLWHIYCAHSLLITTGIAHVAFTPSCTAQLNCSNEKMSSADLLYVDFYVSCLLFKHRPCCFALCSLLCNSCRPTHHLRITVVVSHPVIAVSGFSTGYEEQRGTFESWFHDHSLFSFSFTI